MAVYVSNVRFDDRHEVMKSAFHLNTPQMQSWVSSNAKVYLYVLHHLS